MKKTLALIVLFSVVNFTFGDHYSIGGSIHFDHGSLNFNWSEFDHRAYYSRSTCNEQSYQYHRSYQNRGQWKIRIRRVWIPEVCQRNHRGEIIYYRPGYWELIREKVWVNR